MADTLNEYRDFVGEGGDRCRFIDVIECGRGILRNIQIFMKDSPTRMEILHVVQLENPIAGVNDAYAKYRRNTKPRLG